MDKILLKTKWGRKLVAKMIEKSVLSSTGSNLAINLEDLEIQTLDGDIVTASIRGSVSMSKTDLENLVDKFM